MNSLNDKKHARFRNWSFFSVINYKIIEKDSHSGVKVDNYKHITEFARSLACRRTFNFSPTIPSADINRSTVLTRIRPDKASGLIWIQTV